MFAWQVQIRAARANDLMTPLHVGRRSKCVERRADPKELDGKIRYPLDSQLATETMACLVCEFDDLPIYL